MLHAAFRPTLNANASIWFLLPFPSTKEHSNDKGTIHGSTGHFLARYYSAQLMKKSKKSPTIANVFGKGITVMNIDNVSMIITTTIFHNSNKLTTTIFHNSNKLIDITYPFLLVMGYCCQHSIARC
jgi:hypothetical protein